MRSYLHECNTWDSQVGNGISISANSVRNAISFEISNYYVEKREQRKKQSFCHQSESIYSWNGDLCIKKTQEKYIRCK